MIEEGNIKDKRKKSANNSNLKESLINIREIHEQKMK